MPSSLHNEDVADIFRVEAEEQEKTPAALLVQVLAVLFDDTILEEVGMRKRSQKDPVVLGRILASIVKRRVIGLGTVQRRVGEVIQEV